ncbi:MAG: hypothetical protein J6Y69_09190 [Treponema sp.]|nr:hypothetical protein [Treponema sp.]
MKKVLFVMFLVMGFVSCSSMDKCKQGKLHGLILDSNGDGVSDYKVMKGKKIIALSNDSGYFDIDAVYGEKIELMLRKENCETVEFKQEECDLTKLYVFKVRTVDSVCKEMEDKLDSNECEKIECMYEELPEELKNNMRIKYLMAVDCFVQEKYDQALEFLRDECFANTKIKALDDFIRMLEGTQEETNG